MFKKSNSLFLPRILILQKELVKSNKTLLNTLAKLGIVLEARYIFGAETPKDLKNKLEEEYIHMHKQ